MGIGGGGAAHKLMQLGRALQRRRRRRRLRLDGGLKRAYKACRSGIGIGPPLRRKRAPFPSSTSLSHIDSLRQKRVKWPRCWEGGNNRCSTSYLFSFFAGRSAHSIRHLQFCGRPRRRHLSLSSPPSPPHSPVSSSFRVCSPKLTAKHANRKIITVKESTNGAFPQLTSIIITPSTDGRTDERGGERTRTQRASVGPEFKSSAACVRDVPSLLILLAPRLFLLSLFLLPSAAILRS